MDVVMLPRLQPSVTVVHSQRGEVIMDTNHVERALQAAALARRADALFKAMAGDYLLREQFVTDPSQIFSEYVFGKTLPPEQTTARNQLLYAVMSNQRLLRWFNRYIGDHRDQPPARSKFYRDFSLALVESGDYRVVLALVRLSADGRDLRTLWDQLPPFFWDIGNGPASTDTGPTTQTTDTGPTTQTTDTGPTTQTTDTGPTTQTTDTGPTTQTTDTGPTTQTTDTGPTTQTTDTGPGNIFGSFPPYWDLPLQYLGLYATQLMNSGVLDYV
jgi:hypothetical protein